MAFESYSRMDVTKWWWEFVPCTMASRCKRSDRSPRFIGYTYQLSSVNNNVMHAQPSL